MTIPKTPASQRTSDQSMCEHIASHWRSARSVVVLTGAGLSAESGVPTFRGKEGLWNSFRPEELASMSAFLANPKIVWEWYNWRRSLLANAKPNAGHLAISELSMLARHFTLITQNIDGLHQRAGSHALLELHGNIAVNKCIDCDLVHSSDVEIDPLHIACCKHCGGKLRPGVVWFGENLDHDVIDRAYEAARAADLFFVVGTSAMVFPASQLPLIAHQMGGTIVEINPEQTVLSTLAEYRFAASSGTILPILVQAIRRFSERQQMETV